MTLLEMLSKEETLREMGFKPVRSLRKARKADFIIYTGYGSQNDIAIYSVTEKAKIKSGMLCLEGTVMRHITSTDNPSYIIKDADTDIVYSFSKAEVKKKRLWASDPKVRKWSPEWKMYMKERLPFLRQYKKDMEQYFS